MKFGWEIAVAVVAAVILAGVVVWVSRLKMRGVLKYAVNTLAGAALIAGLSAFNVIVLPFNLFNALIVGVLGLPGACVVVAATLIL